MPPSEYAAYETDPNNVVFRSSDALPALRLSRCQYNNCVADMMALDHGHGSSQMSERVKHGWDSCSAI